MSPIQYVALASALLAAASACSSPPPRPTATPRTAARTASPAASPVASQGESRIQLGEFTYTDYGPRDVQGRATQDLDAGDFYFKGTFLHGSPGQRLKLRIRNVAQGPHNFSIPSQQVDKDLPPGRERTEVDVTLPESGALRFFCKLHADRGMNGQLLAGDATPQPVAGGSDGDGRGSPRS